LADKLNPARLTKWQEEEASARKAKQTHQREQATGEQGPGEVEVRWRVRSPEGKESSCPGQPSRDSGAAASPVSGPAPVSRAAAAISRQARDEPVRVQSRTTAASEAGATSGGGATSGSPGNGGRGGDRRGQPVPKSERDVRRPVPESERNGRRGKIAGSVGAGRPPERTPRPSSSRVGAEASKRRRPWRGAATELTRSGGNFWEAAAELALGRRRREEISGLVTGGRVSLRPGEKK